MIPCSMMAKMRSIVNQSATMSLSQHRSIISFLNRIDLASRASHSLHSLSQSSLLHLQTNRRPHDLGERCSLAASPKLDPIVVPRKNQIGKQAKTKYFLGQRLANRASGNPLLSNSSKNKNS
jgi:hypothetical protein